MTWPRVLAGAVLVLLAAGVLAVGPGGEPPDLGFARDRAVIGLPLPAVTEVVNQVDPAMIDPAPIRAAAASWGLAYTEGGPPACGPGHSPPGAEVVCVSPVPCRCWSIWWYAGGISLDPRLIGRGDAEVQYAVCHELANALGYPETPPGTRDCTGLALDPRWLNPPRR